MRKQFLNISFLASLGLPLVLLVCWHFQNQAYPRLDPGDFLTLSSRLLEGFRDNSLFQGIYNLYADRSFKPTFQPIIAIPFFAISGGNVLLTLTMVCFFLYGIFSLYVYLLGKEFLTGIRLIVWTWLINTVPWIVINAHGFTSDLLLLTCGLPTIYHLKKCNFFQNEKHTVLFGFWLAMVFGARPVLGLILFGIPAFISILNGLGRKNINRFDLAFPIIQIILAIGISAYSLSQSSLGSFEPVQFHLLLFLLPTFVLPFFLQKKLNLSKHFLTGFSLCYAFVVVWYVPFIQHIFRWGHYALFSKTMTSQRTAAYTWIDSFFSGIFMNLGGYPVLLLAVLALVGFFRILKKQHLHLLLGTASMVLILPILGSFGHSNAELYYTFSFFVLYLATTALALSPKFRFPNIRLTGVGLVLGIQIYYSLFITFGKPAPDNWFNNTFLRHPGPLIAPIHPFRKEDPTLTLVKKISELAGDRADITVGIVQIPRPAGIDPDLRFYYQLTDNFALTLAKNEMNLKTRIELSPLLPPPGTTSLKDFLSVMKSKWDYLIVGPLEAKPWLEEVRWRADEDPAMNLAISLLDNKNYKIPHTSLLSEFTIPEFYSTEEKRTFRWFSVTKERR